MCMHSERDMTQSHKNTFINTTRKQQKESEAAAISVRRHIALGVLPVYSLQSAFYRHRYFNTSSFAVNSTQYDMHQEFSQSRYLTLHLMELLVTQGAAMHPNH